MGVGDPLLVVLYGEARAVALAAFRVGHRKRRGRHQGEHHAEGQQKAQTSASRVISLCAPVSRWGPELAKKFLTRAESPCTFFFAHFVSLTFHPNLSYRSFESVDFCQRVVFSLHFIVFFLFKPK
jgi:hypothetical protein